MNDGPGASGEGFDEVLDVDQDGYQALASAEKTGTLATFTTLPGASPWPWASLQLLPKVQRLSCNGVATAKNEGLVAASCVLSEP